MSEYVSNDIEAEPATALDREQIIKRLLELGIEVSLEDWAEFDDNALLDYLATLITIYDIDFDLDQLVEVVDTEEPSFIERVISTLQDYDIGVEQKEIEGLSREELHRAIATFAKWHNISPDEVGKACFGSDWEEGRWI